jgi:hypothetical protein
MTTPESAILTAVLDLLVWQYRAVVIRINSGATQPVESPQVGVRASRPVFFYHWQVLSGDKLKKGVSDVLALLPSAVDDSSLSGYFKNPNPLLVAVECKSPNRRQRNGQPAQPSPEQALFLEAVRERGGVGMVIDDVEQLIKELESRGY